MLEDIRVTRRGLVPDSMNIRLHLRRLRVVEVLEDAVGDCAVSWGGR